MTNPVLQAIESELDKSAPSKTGKLGTLVARYTPQSDRLLGFLLKLSYEDMRIVTCDVWKSKCGGVPRNSFVMVRLSQPALKGLPTAMASQCILARVTESVPTPIDTEIQGTIFEVHKVQAILDPMTNKELQWAALQATTLGTYYDEAGEIEFGNDVASFLAPHSYEVYVPTDEDLGTLINSFVRTSKPLVIGTLRFTETPPVEGKGNIDVLVDPEDFIGQESGNRTALFGKTRMGKSNTIKVIADTILKSDRQVAQVIFDPSGEYTYLNEQDNTSLYSLHAKKCVRYSLNPRLPAGEAGKGFEVPEELRVNFFENPILGHSLLRSQFAVEFPSRPNYILPLLDWEPVDPSQSPPATDQSAFNRYWRTMGLWWAALIKADYSRAPATGKLASVPVPLRAETKKHLAAQPGVAAVAVITKNAAGEDVLDDRQPPGALATIYEQIWPVYRQNPTWFPASGSGPYFTPVDEALLRILGDSNISGPIYLRPFRKFHSATGSSFIAKILGHINDGKTVLVDYANAPEEVYNVFSERIAGAILSAMMERFANNSLGGRFVTLYFEEAHRLFRADDKDLNSVYNRLAKEGAKFHVGMVYATQSMTTMSPDLLKNTENFVIAHLNDDREIKEVTRRYEFRDIAEDVQRSRSRGFVRMITLSHRFALPVQIRKFG
jgi:hypothetical protein